MWVGLTLSYVVPALPPSTMVISTAVAIYAGALVFASRSRIRFWPRLIAQT